MKRYTDYGGGSDGGCRTRPLIVGPHRLYPAAQGADNVNRGTRLCRGAQAVYRLFVDEYFDVLADAVLLIDGAEAKAGIASVDLGEHLSDGRSARLDDILLVGVGSERRRNVDPHLESSAASTE